MLLRDTGLKQSIPSIIRISILGAFSAEKSAHCRRVNMVVIVVWENKHSMLNLHQLQVSWLALTRRWQNQIIGLDHSVHLKWLCNFLMCKRNVVYSKNGWLFGAANITLHSVTSMTITVISLSSKNSLKTVFYESEFYVFSELNDQPAHIERRFCKTNTNAQEISFNTIALDSVIVFYVTSVTMHFFNISLQEISVGENWVIP